MFITSLPKSIGFGEMEALNCTSTGHFPVPLNATSTVGVSGSLEGMDKVPVTGPSASGRKFTYSLQLVLAASPCEPAEVCYLLLLRTRRAGGPSDGLC